MSHVTHRPRLALAAAIVSIVVLPPWVPTAGIPVLAGGGPAGGEAPIWPARP